MSQNKYYSLSWDSYQASICKGFAELQNVSRSKFVDMTLVAEGHLVKVHKNVICLASSFIKQIIKSAPCEHPIIFLNDVSHETLCYLLEYIYMGEVKVGEDKLPAVLRVANELKLCGLEQLSKNRPLHQVSEARQTIVNSATDDHTVGTTYFVLPMQRSANAIVSNERISQDRNEYQLELDTTKTSSALDTSSTALALENCIHFMPNGDTDPAATCRSAPLEPAANTEPPSFLSLTMIDTKGPQQYSMSSRGCPQLLLNRYVYNLHHQAENGRRRRWRCADYRRSRCAAYVDTVGDAVTARKNVHHHVYHDETILKKARANRVFDTQAAATRASQNDRSVASPSAQDGAAGGEGL